MLLKITLYQHIAYSNHFSTQKIKTIFNTDSKFDFPKPTASGINKITKSLDTNKATEPDGIPAKFFKMSANVIDCEKYLKIYIPSMPKLLQ